MSIPAGTRLGVYEIVAPIGAGGMGEVYRARDTRLDRSVAIKVLPAEYADNVQLRLRFDREAKTISQLNHPNICALYDVGKDKDNGTPYLVMELLDGQSLATRLERGPLPLPETLTYGVQIAEALERAHREGIVHRDLKPGNVMLTRSGAKLLDFGLAKSVSVLATPDGETQQKSLTAEGTIVGTFQYMAPEQLEGIDADVRTDIFALGSLLYEMASGKRAFEGKTRTSLIAAIVSANPAPVSQLQPLTPASLEHVIAKCLEKEPDARWQSAHDIAEQLRWIRDRGAEERTIRDKRPAVREWIAWTVAAVSIAALAALAWRLNENRASRTPLFAAINPPPGQTFAFDVGRAGSLTISPDGKYVTFATAESNGDHHLWIRALDSDAAVLVPGSASEEYYPFWSPDSRSLAFFSDGKMKRTDTHGSTPVVIADAPTGRSGSWSEDGVILFSPTSTGPIHRVSAAGGKSVPVTTLDTSRRETTHRWATFLPDGRHFLYLAASHAGPHTDNSSAVIVGSIDDGRLRKQILAVGGNVAFADGNLLYVRDRSLVAQRFDTRALELRGDPVLLARAVNYDPVFWRGLFAVSNNRSLVYVPGEADPKSTLQWIDRQGGSLGTSGQPAPYMALGLSPDDSTCAVVLPSPAGTTDIWLHDFSRGINQRFTFGEGDEAAPVWSPDGNRIVFSDSRQGTDGLYVKDIGATADRLVYYGAEYDTEGAAWSPDGKYTVATRHRTGRTGTTDIVIVPMDGSGPPAPFLPSTFDQDAGTFSPDGKWLAYSSKEGGRKEIFVARFPSGLSKQQVSTEGVNFIAAWRGDQLFYGTNDGKMISVTLTESASRIAIGTPRVMPFDMPESLTFAHRSDRILEAVEPKLRPEVALIANWQSLLPR